MIGAQPALHTAQAALQIPATGGVKKSLQSHDLSIILIVKKAGQVVLGVVRYQQYYLWFQQSTSDAQVTGPYQVKNDATKISLEGHNLHLYIMIIIGIEFGTIINLGLWQTQ
ncbi:hypothetical protein P691DRAFT_781433 [Macrolepiota fuliginosa MF-IS2]|uniref:Uncharacterized protein n=1 Tax=Macrolepiota fuliginosa MF-IS2 TaxID=1400762 RepID=A0A9P5WZH6_9AGAR|nr:hypothetical protein P691DRAFT_781433 [Macrolepiota fuliginosa MF-IS2]